MRATADLHPELQKKITELKELAEREGIKFLTGECVRTAAEQDALYAKGRTEKGSIVTNARGSSYSSMHQWGVAFDVYLNMDIDGDGQWTDDIYNNSTRMFSRLGEIGKRIGLEWGGDWKSIKDLCHFQLPDWGSTASKLKAQYKTPDRFMASWNRGDGAAVPDTPAAEEHFYPEYGPGTVFVRLQQALGVPAGSSAEATLAKTITLRKGCTGGAVALLQEYWKGLGYYNGRLDGIWGKQSDAAAYSCQKEQVGYKNPDRVYTARGKSWAVSLGI